MRFRGFVQRYFPERRFGFVRYIDGSAFVHISQVLNAHILIEGQEVSFDIEEGRGTRPSAVSVEVLTDGN